MDATARRGRAGLGRRLCAAAGLWFLLAAPAAFAQSESVIENVRLGSGSMSYEAKRLVVRGSSLSQARLAELFSSSTASAWTQGIAGLDADEIYAPELVSTVKTAQVDQRTTYREVSLKAIKAGAVGSLSAAGATMEGSQQGRPVTGSNGPVMLRDLDLAAALALFSEDTAARPESRIYGSFSIEAVKVVDPAGIATEVGRISGTDFRAKPIAGGWLATVNALGSARPDTRTGPEGSTAIRALADVIGAMSVGSVEISDLSMKGRVEKDDSDLVIALKRASYRGATASAKGELRLEGALFSVGDARMSYGELALGGVDPDAAVAALRDVSVDPKDPKPEVFRRLLPAASSFRIADIDIDFPPDPKKGATGRIRMKLGRFELSADKPVDGIPSELRLALRQVETPVTSDPSFAMITSLGYSAIEASMGVNANWDSRGQELSLRDLSIDARDMGTVTIRGIFGRIGPDVFDPNPTLAAVALTGATAKAAEITLEDRGLFDRVIAREARRQKRSAEDVRREYGVAASIGIPAVLGGSPGAKNLAQAVARFVAKPGRLTVQARARTAEGYGIADYMANPSVSGVLQSIDLTASNQ